MQIKPWEKVAIVVAINKHLYHWWYTGAQTFKSAFNRSWISVLQMNEEMFNFLFISSGVSACTLCISVSIVVPLTFWVPLTFVYPFVYLQPSFFLFMTFLYIKPESLSVKTALQFSSVLLCCFWEKTIFSFFFSSCHISRPWKLVWYLLN